MGTEEFWVPVALAAASGGAELVNQRNANTRQQNAETQNIMDQQALEQKASSGARQLAQNISQNTPGKIKSQATGDYVSQLRKNAAGAASDATGDKNQFGQSVSALAPAAGASSRYGSDVASAQKEVGNYGNTLADEMGTVDAAVRQRQNEGLSMQDYATNLQGLNQQSFGTNFVNQLRAQQAGQANPWVSLFAGMANAGARSYQPSTTPQGGTLVPGQNLISKRYSGGFAPTDGTDFISG